MNSKICPYIFLPLFLFIFISENVKSQNSTNQDSTRLIGVQAGFAYEIPGGIMAERFGSNANVGGGFFFKTKSNIIFQLEGSYIFGENLKEDTLFHLIRNPDGFIIDGDGMFADIRTYQRGYTIMLNAGKVFNIFNDNPNSGLLLMAGGGFLQHRIRIENPGKTVGQLQGDYKKGYDKLTNGPALSQYIGYVHFSDNNISNFRIGFQFTQGFTKARRNYDFDYGKKDTRSRLDLLYGIKINWKIPFRRKQPEAYYFF